MTLPTAPPTERDLTRLQRIMRLAYSMQPEDEAALAAQIERQRSRAWQTALEEEAQKVGVRARANAPRRDDLQYLRDVSRSDAESIARTYNADLEKQIRALFTENPRGNRQFYASRLEAWYSKRAAWKDRQIALMNEKSARYYATQRFREMNLIGRAKFRFDGPSPVCDECIDNFAAGEVEQEYVDTHPTPVHIGCNHDWKGTKYQLGVSRRDVWIG